MRQTAKEIMKMLKAKEFCCLIADGTRFGYGETYRMNWEKGKELRKVKFHVKTEVLVGIVRGKTVVVDVNVGKGYSDENKLLVPMLERLEVRARYFLGDAYYGKSVKVLKKIKKLRIIGIIPVRDTLRTNVRNKYRLWVKENYELRREVYRKNRYRVEQIIGKAKNGMGDRDWTKDFHTAGSYVLARFVILNLALLLELLLLSLFLLRFFKQVLRSLIEIFVIIYNKNTLGEKK